VCIFGVDDRDEGKHCIYSEGKYGSLGWCYTSSEKNEWGSCNDSCPLWGQAKILEKRLRVMKKELTSAKVGLNATLNATKTVLKAVHPNATVPKAPAVPEKNSSAPPAAASAAPES